MELVSTGDSGVDWSQMGDERMQLLYEKTVTVLVIKKPRKIYAVFILWAL